MPWPHRLTSSEVYREMDDFQQKAYALILGDARKAFDLSQEKDAVRDRYGRNQFGQSCLLARRLVEAGVPFITINDGGWDTHKDNFETMQQEAARAGSGHLSAARRPGAARPATGNSGHLVRRVRAHARESPTKRPGSADGITGPMHFRPSWRAADSRAARSSAPPTRAAKAVRDRPVYPWDLSASIYKLLGIDPHGKLPHPQGCVAYVSPQASRLLTEIM